MHVKHKKSAAVVAGTIMVLGMASPAVADTGAEGTAAGAQGLLSGNVVQAPVHLPLNLCGNSIDVAALLNPALGGTCLTG